MARNGTTQYRTTLLDPPQPVKWTEAAEPLSRKTGRIKRGRVPFGTLPPREAIAYLEITARLRVRPNQVCSTRNAEDLRDGIRTASEWWERL